MFGISTWKLATKHLRTVKVGRGPGVAQILGVVAGEKQANVALFIEGMAPGVAAADLEVMRQPLLYVRFQCVVGRVTNCLEVRGIGTKPDIRCPEVGVARVERVPWFNRNRAVIVSADPPSSGSRRPCHSDAVSPQIGLVGVAMPGSLIGIGITAWRPRLPVYPIETATVFVGCHCTFRV